jgi:RNA polymerase sigma factor (sigma-70 family)
MMGKGPNTSHFARLLDRIRAGDPAANEQLVNDAYLRVHELTHFILRGRFPAAGRGLETDDVVSVSLENFTRMLRAGLPRVPDNPAELFGLVAQIVRRVAISEVRRRAGPKFRAQFPGAELPADQPLRDARPPQEEVMERLAWQEMVAQLPAAEAKLIDWRFVWQMTNEEIAAELSCDPSTVSKRLRKALLTLRRLMADPNGGGAG